MTVNIGKGDFGETPGEAITLDGHRVQANIIYVGGAQQPQCFARVYGLSMSLINTLTGSGQNGWDYRHSTLTIAASTNNGAMATLYQGGLRRSYAQFNSQPDVCLFVQGQGSIDAAVKPVNARSYVGPTDVATICADIAKSMNVSFENNGVSVILDNPYFRGTDYSQLMACADAANISFIVDRGVLAIWPIAKSRTKTQEIVVSAATGLIGYPDYSDQGIIFNTLMNPELAIGKVANVQSELQPVCGKWTCVSVIHTIESQIQGGPWFTEVQAQRGIQQ